MVAVSLKKEKVAYTDAAGKPVEATFDRAAPSISPRSWRLTCTSNEVGARLAPFREGDHLSLPRTLVLVTARSL